MGLFHYLWSRTAASNATADSSVNWAEGMAPSAVNDSARAMMASAAAFRDDIAGAIVTGGTSTAYTVTSYQIFDTLAHMDKMVIAFTPHATNGATVTLNVDGLGAKPLRPAPSVELPAGSLILGTPYVALYNNSDAVWYLQGGVGGANSYSIPLGGSLNYWGATTPNSIFAFPAGQAVSRTTYATLFALIGTTYGAGDGSTTFNLPDVTGRTLFMKEAAATRLTSTYATGNSANLGAALGADHTSNTIAQGNLPNVNLTSSAQNTTIFIRQGAFNLTAGASTALDLLQTIGGGGIQSQTYPVGGQTVPLGGSGTALQVGSVPPGIICNQIMRII